MVVLWGNTNDENNKYRWLYCGARLALGETAFLLCAAGPGQAGQLALTIHTGGVIIIVGVVVVIIHEYCT